ncbi:DUF7452 domain-containing protein [Emticicia agri]|uniref:DUF7452 domain-containing protein n=2 Tax=Emticicia agri TaxID=2492393 RepID=A0A4Q5LNW0_9BACT|nr:hypothetical protein [Emticicia agri]RYU91009.1 hypothetical protein EWM59_27315 [Emticicia agri]RYU91044.1 hypothetical protein EWM59_27115 [Emticicia agri]
MKKFILLQLLSIISLAAVAQSITPEKLQVSGSIKADTAKIKVLQIQPNAGAGKVFTSDANGNGTWQTMANAQALTAFVHRATSANTIGHITTLSYPNQKHTDIVLVTHNYNPAPYGSGSVAYNNHPVGVYWIGSAWTIYNEDIAAITGNAFNVLVIRQ